MTYGTEAKATHLSNAYWFHDTGDMQPKGTSAETLTATAKRGIITPLNKLSVSRDVLLFGRLHSDVCKVLPYLLPVVRLQIRLTKAPPSYYLMRKSAY